MVRSACFGRRSFLAVFLVLALPGATAFAANRFSVPDLLLPEGATAQEILVRCEHDVAVTALSLAMRYDPADIAVTGVSAEGTSVADADFFGGSQDGGIIAYGCVLDTEVPFTKYLAPATDHILARITVDLLAPAGSIIDLSLENGIDTGTYIYDNTLTNQSGATIDPELSSGQIVVLLDGEPLPPVADAGADVAVAEVAPVTLDASGSFSPTGKPLTYQWAQILGPPATDPTGQDTAVLTFGAPAVATDEEMVFEVSVSDGDATQADQVTVSVIDLDSRQVVVTEAPGSETGLIEGGNKAIAFKASILWSSIQEDAYWSVLRFTASGPGNEEKLLSGARVYLDNGDNQLGPEDQQLGEELQLESDDGTLDFQFFHLLEDGSAQTFYLVVDVGNKDKGARAMVLWPLILLGALGGFAALRRSVESRRRMLASLLLATTLGLPFFLSACGGGGGGGGNKNIRFDIVAPADIGVQGATTGIFVESGSIPLQGPTIAV